MSLPTANEIADVLQAEGYQVKDVGGVRGPAELIGLPGDWQVRIVSHGDGLQLLREVICSERPGEYLAQEAWPVRSTLVALLTDMAEAGVPRGAR